jgi:hypothetical protein
MKYLWCEKVTSSTYIRNVMGKILIDDQRNIEKNSSLKPKIE